MIILNLFFLITSQELLKYSPKTRFCASYRLKFFDPAHKKMTFFCLYEEKGKMMFKLIKSRNKAEKQRFVPLITFYKSLLLNLVDNDIY